MIHVDAGHPPEQPRAGPDGQRGQDRQRPEHGQRGRERHPLQLLALGATGPAEAHHQRRGADHHGEVGDGEGELVDDQQRPPEAGQVERVLRCPGPGVKGPGREHDHQEADHRHRHRRPCPPPPAGRWQRPGGREQQDKAEQGQGRDDDGREVQAHLGGRRDRPGPGQQPVVGIRRGHPTRVQAQPGGQQQPPHRMAGPPAGQHRPDRGRAHRRQHRRRHLGPERGQVGPPGLPEQVVQPPDDAQPGHGQPPQPPGQPSRPPPGPFRPATSGHRAAPPPMCPPPAAIVAPIVPGLRPDSVTGASPSTLQISERRASTSRRSCSSGRSGRSPSGNGSGRPGAGSSANRGTRWVCRCGTAFPRIW
jgi:hypothetical protein